MNWSLIRAAAALCVTLLITGPVYAAGLVLGNFCVDGASAETDARQTIFTAEGKWTRTYFKALPQNGRRRLLVVFSAPPQPTGAVQSCQALVDSENAAGRKAFLAGQVEQLNVSGWIFEANSGSNKYHIDAGDFRAKLGRVQFGKIPVAGGTSDLAGSKLWIANSLPILIEAASVSGELEIAAWNRTIENATLKVSGVQIADLSLAAARPDEENIVYRVDLKTQQGRLWNGKLASRPVKLVGEAIDLDSVFLRNYDAEAKSILITAAAGKIAVDLLKIDGVSREAGVRGVLANFNASQTNFQIGRIAAAVEQTPSGFLASDYSFEKAALSAAKGVVSGQSDNAILQGPVTAKVDSLQGSNLQAELVFAQPSSRVLTMLTDTPGAAYIRIGRLADVIKVSGKLDVASLLFGKMLVEANQRIALNESVVDALAAAPVLEFPVSFDLPPASGSVKFMTEDYRVALRGGLKAFRLKGLLKIPLADLESSHLAIGKGDLELALGAAAFLEPVIAGVVPTLSTTDLSIVSESEVSIGMKSAGILKTSVAEMIVGQPVLKMGAAGKKAKASLTLKTRAGADLLFSLSTGRVLIGRADLLAENTRFHFLEPGGEIDLGGTRLANPDIGFERFEVSIVRGDGVEIATAKLMQFKANADRLYKPADPERPTEITYSSDLAAPLSIGVATAEKVEYEHELSLQHLVLEDFSFATTNGDVHFGKDISVSEARIALGAKRIEHVVANDAQFVQLAGAHISADGKLDAGQNNRPRFAIALNAEGRADQLSGSGSASIGAFTGSKTDALDVGFTCSDGNKLRAPVEYNYALGSTSLDLTADRGQFSAYGSTGPFGLVFHTTSGRECHGPTKKWVIVPEQSGWTWGVCGFPPEICKWSWTIPEVNFKYNIKLAVRSAAATLFLSNPVVLLKDGHTRACNRGLAKASLGFFVGGYSPQIVTNFPDADRIINTFISVAFEPAQSLFVSSLLQQAGQFAESIINIGQVICYG